MIRICCAVPQKVDTLLFLTYYSFDGAQTFLVTRILRNGDSSKRRAILNQLLDMLVYTKFKVLVECLLYLLVILIFGRRLLQRACEVQATNLIFIPFLYFLKVRLSAVNS
jgi:hypothetical protein